LTDRNPDITHQGTHKNSRNHTLLKRDDQSCIS